MQEHVLLLKERQLMLKTKYSKDLFKSVTQLLCVGVERVRCSSPRQFRHIGRGHKVVIKRRLINVNKVCREVYEQLVAAGLIIPKPETEPPSLPMDYSWAQVGHLIFVIN